MGNASRAVKRRLRATMLVAFLAPVSAGHAPSAWAQDMDPAPATVAEHAFDIPRGDLASVVIRIARIAGTPVAFPAEIAAGHMAGPIQGRQTVSAALMQALVGTGLESVPGPGSSYTIRPAADPGGHQPRTQSSPRADTF